MKVNWQEHREKLEKLISDNVSYMEIGRMFNVTSNAVKKAAVKLNIPIPQRRKINPSETFGKGKNNVIETCKNCGNEFSHPSFLGVVDFCCDECKKNFLDSKTSIIKEPNVKDFYNKKNIGELGEQIAIGELGKFGLQVLVPLSDNLPFDLVVFTNNKFYKCQVKTTSNLENGCVTFNLLTGNGYLNKMHKYTEDEVDVFILCDLNQIYILKTSEVNGKTTITIRYKQPLSNIVKTVHYAIDYIISVDRIKKVFN